MPLELIMIIIYDTVALITVGKVKFLKDAPTEAHNLYVIVKSIIIGNQQSIKTAYPNVSSMKSKTNVC